MIHELLNKMKQLTSQYVISTATVGTLCNPIRPIQNAQNHHGLPGSVKYPRISEFTVEAIVCSCYGCVVSEIVFAWAVLKSDPIAFYLISKSLFHETVAKSWWRHQMETFSALLALCAGNSPVTGEFHAQRQVTRSIGVFFDLSLNKRLSKQSWGWWIES